MGLTSVTLFHLAPGDTDLLFPPTLARLIFRLKLLIHKPLPHLHDLAVFREFQFALES